MVITSMIIVTAITIINSLMKNLLGASATPGQVYRMIVY